MSAIWCPACEREHPDLPPLNESETCTCGTTNPYHAASCPVADEILRDAFTAPDADRAHADTRAGQRRPPEESA